MVSRLSELQASNEIAIEMQQMDATPAYDDDSDMPEFFSEISEIKSSMSVIRHNIKSIQDAYDKHSWSPSDTSSTLAELEELLDTTNAIASTIRNKLKQLRTENDDLSPEDPQKKMRSSMHTVLSKKFILLLQEYQALQNSYREKTRERFQRQAEIVKPGVSREEVDTMLESGGDYFGDKLLNENRHGEAKNALARIQEQKRDLNRLERNLQEINNMFLDMNALVDTSTERLDVLEGSVSNVVLNSAIAAQNLVDAEAAVMAKRRRFTLLASGIGLIILIIVGALAAIIGIPIAIKLGIKASMFS
eukprot:TRINITY_DN533_c0_g2_i1.p1 TRINITY_DN533_c0_g2~~TRINITY_DN533_c0_g2_i1.p1  ORF type:complete len:348 (+),score=115.99 TRINITY_DN533_c0_g2_i1:130-1044(+)